MRKLILEIFVILCMQFNVNAQTAIEEVSKSKVNLFNKKAFNAIVAKDKLVLLNPSPYCPTTTTKPNFNWKDYTRKSVKNTYSLKLVQMTREDSDLSQFDKRKVIFEKVGLTKNELNFPEGAQMLKMGNLYAYRVQKFNGHELVATSEVFPFVVIDPKLPFVSQMLCCQNSLLKNGDFLEGCIPSAGNNPGSVNDWRISYGNPIIRKLEDGCGSPNYIEMRGNDTAGSAIEQNTNIQQGKFYKLTACVRIIKGSKLDYAYINAVAFNGSITNSSNLHPNPSAKVAKIGWSGKIKSKEWVTFSMQVWKATKDFQKIAIFCTSKDKSFAAIEIDKICLEETTDSIPCDDFEYTENGGVLLPDDLTNADIRNRDTTYIENHRGRLVDLYPGYDGTTSIYKQNDPCSSIGGTIPLEAQKFNFNDTLKMLGFEGGVKEFEKLLEQKFKDESKQKKLNPILPININACQKDFIPDPTQPFSGRDIIFVHGLKLNHICDNTSGIEGALKIWPDDKSEFYNNGYYKKQAVEGWQDHITEWIRKRGYKNRILVVAYNCSQRADVAAHAILTQIRDAMAGNNNNEVDIVEGDKRGRDCFGRNAVLISHSTGALVANIAIAIAEKSKTEIAYQTEYGNVGFIADNIKLHISLNGAHSGSNMAISWLDQLNGNNRQIGSNLVCKDKPHSEMVKNIANKSILIDLQPFVSVGHWHAITSTSPVPTLTIAGGHAHGTWEAVGPMNILMHYGYDDGVVSMGSQSANTHFETNSQPVGYNKSGGLNRIYDLGIGWGFSQRANRYFLSQTYGPSGNYVAGASTPYLSPTGMLQPVGNIPLISHPENRLKNHYSFLQSASDHYKGARGKKPGRPLPFETNILGQNYGNEGEGYNALNHNSTSGFTTLNYQYPSHWTNPHWEESLVITNNAVFSKGLVNSSIINIPEERVRGQYVDFDVWGPAFYFKKPFQIIIKWEPMFHVHYTLWERKYHLMSDSDNKTQLDYVYQYILR